jgi:hypothetical protein
MARGGADWLLALLLGGAALIAACGGGLSSPPPNVAPANATNASSGAGEPPAAASTGASMGGAPNVPAQNGTVGPANSASAVPPPVAPVAVEMKSPVPSAMVGELAAMGLDAAHLPPIEKVDPKALRRVMKLLARALGAKCGDCHAVQEGQAGGDFAAPTRRKKIAAKMWDELAVKLQMSDGSPLFCDSCHQGRIVQLDRTDKKALGRWMDANFVDKLKRRDGREHDCETCHVDMEMHLLTKWGGG